MKINKKSLEEMGFQVREHDLFYEVWRDGNSIDYVKDNDDLRALSKLNLNQLISDFCHLSYNAGQSNMIASIESKIHKFLSK